MVRLIGEKYYVKSESIKNKYYELNKNLSCECKGYKKHGRCKHQKMVEEYLLSGELADTSRTHARIELSRKKRNNNRFFFSNNNLFNDPNNIF